MKRGHHLSISRLGHKKNTKGLNEQIKTLKSLTLNENTEKKMKRTFEVETINSSGLFESDDDVVRFVYIREPRTGCLSRRTELVKVIISKGSLGI